MTCTKFKLTTVAALGPLRRADDLQGHAHGRWRPDKGEAFDGDVRWMAFQNIDRDDLIFDPRRLIEEVERVFRHHPRAIREGFPVECLVAVQPLAVFVVGEIRLLR